jgi:hypothetical protein
VNAAHNRCASTVVHVRGGLFKVRCQATYVQLEAGRRDIATVVQLDADLSDRWSLGLALPYLYKDRKAFPRPDLRLSNKGLGDIDVMVRADSGRSLPPL